jgi:hypothetical protein
VDRCEVVFDYWYPAAKVKADPQFVELSLAASDRVQQEDVGISESVQRGLGSSSYDQGRYAPAIEHAMHHFHRLLARRIGTGAGRDPHERRAAQRSTGAGVGARRLRTPLRCATHSSSSRDVRPLPRVGSEAARVGLERMPARREPPGFPTRSSAEGSR